MLVSFLEHVRNDLIISEGVGSLCAHLSWYSFQLGAPIVVDAYVPRYEDFRPLKELLALTLVRASTSRVTAG
jgi:hypothetical protein